LQWQHLFFATSRQKLCKKMGNALFQGVQTCKMNAAEALVYFIAVFILF